MKSKFTLIFLLFTLSLFSQEQETINYKVSKPYSTITVRNKDFFTDGKEVLGVKVYAESINDNFQVLLQKYSFEKMNYVSKNRYHDLPKNFIYEGTLKIQEKFYFFYSSWIGKKTKKERLFYREIDFKEGTFIGDIKQVIGFEGKLVKSKLGTKFDIKISKDESKILIKYQKKIKTIVDVNNHNIFEFTVFDTSFNSIWTNQYKMPYIENKVKTLDFIISNKGVVYLISKVFFKDVTIDGNTFYYRLELLKIDNKNIVITKINLQDKFINDLKIEELNNKIYCAGFYNIGRNSFFTNDFFNDDNQENHKIIYDKLDYTKGVFLFIIDQKEDKINTSYFEIPLKILNQYVTKIRSKKNSKNVKKSAFKKLRLQDIHISNEGIIVIGEVNYDNSSINQSTTFYEDILITKIGLDKELNWMRRIPKRQKNALDKKGGMSYSYFKVKNNHYFIYLDNIKNKNLPLDKKPAWHTDGVGGFLTSVKINDITGDLTKNYIVDFKHVQKKIKAYLFMTGNIVNIDDSFFFEIYKGKKEDVFIKVDF